jgi:hypothetical protein
VTQLETSPLFTRHRLKVVKSIRRLFGCRLERIPRRRLAGLKTVSKSAYEGKLEQSIRQAKDLGVQPDEMLSAMLAVLRRSAARQGLWLFKLRLKRK